MTIIIGIKRCSKDVRTVHDGVRDPHKIRLPQLHGALSRAEPGRMTVPHNLHGRAFKQKASLIVHSMQGALLAQAPAPWDTRTPAQDNGQRMRPHR